MLGSESHHGRVLGGFLRSNEKFIRLCLFLFLRIGGSDWVVVKVRGLGLQVDGPLGRTTQWSSDPCPSLTPSPVWTWSLTLSISVWERERSLDVSSLPVDISYFRNLLSCLRIPVSSPLRFPCPQSRCHSLTVSVSPLWTSSTVLDLWYFFPSNDSNWNPFRRLTLWRYSWIWQEDFFQFRIFFLGSSQKFRRHQSDDKDTTS